MQTLIRDTLDAWRDAERTLERMPPSSPDHETVALVALDLRETYQRLTEARDLPQEIVERCRAIVSEAQGLLRRIHGDVANADAPVPGESGGSPGTEAISRVGAAEAS